MLSDHTRKMIDHFPTRASEWATSLILFGWATLTYLTNGKSMTGAYDAMTNVMDATTWAAMFMILSGIRIMLLIINGALKRSPHLRSAFSFLSCFAWFQITMAFSSTEMLTNDLAAYPVLLALDFYNAYRIAIEARLADEGLKRNGGRTD